MADIALLPYTEHVLPRGRLQLTIAEARHIKIVKECSVKGECFALAMLDENSTIDTITQIPAIATKVKIIDFDPLEAGLLGITVEGVKNIQITKISIDPDDLLIASFKSFINWSDLPRNRDNNCLAEKLKLFYATLPEVGALYPTPQYDNITWVCQRWIEILPIEVKYKQLLVQQETPKLAIRFLIKLLKNRDLTE